MTTSVRGRGCRNWAIGAFVALVLAGSATAVLLHPPTFPAEIWLVPPVESASRGALFTNLRPAPHDDALEGYFGGPSEVMGDGTIVDIEVQPPNSAWQDFLGWLQGFGTCWLEPAVRYTATAETCSIKGVEWRRFVLRDEGASPR